MSKEIETTRVSGGAIVAATSQLKASALIDSLPISSMQYRVFGLVALCVLCEGYDTQSVAYVAPILTRQWHLVTGAFGTVFAASLIGSALGSLFIAPLSDRIGRKPLIAWSALAVGVLTLACAWTHSARELEAVRLLAGIGLGTTLPNSLALLAEYSPNSRRMSIVSTTFCSLALGAALGGILAGWLVRWNGWPAVFWTGGSFTLLLALALLGLLPESLPFLASHEPASERTRVTLRRLVGAQRAQSISLAGDDGSAAGTRVKAGILFQGDHGVITVLYGALAFLTLLTLYLLNNWLPTLLHSLGFSLEQASILTAIFQVGGILGAILLGRAADSLGPIRVVFMAYVLGALLIALLGVATDLSWIGFGCLGAGFALVGAQSCNNAMVASLYPVAVRGTAIGWNLTIGRIGSIVGPTASGLLLMHNLSARRVLLLAALVPVCAALVLLPAPRFVRRVLPG